MKPLIRGWGGVKRYSFTSSFQSFWVLASSWSKKVVYAAVYLVSIVSLLRDGMKVNVYFFFPRNCLQLSFVIPVRISPSLRLLS